MLTFPSTIGYFSFVRAEKNLVYISKNAVMGTPTISVYIRVTLLMINAAMPVTQKSETPPVFSSCEKYCCECLDLPIWL